MRAKQFIVEYNQQATMQRFGDKLLKNAARDGSPEISTVFNLLNSGKEIDDHTKGNALISIMQAIEHADPTKNKEYTVFLAKMYAGGGWGAHIEDLESKIKPALEKFHLLKLRKKLPSPRNDIMRYADLADFVAVLDEYPDPEEKQQADKGQAKTVFENDKVRIVVPEDQTAACYYGQGTRWCTASRTSTNYFDHYNADGPLYILLPKQPQHEGEKYQLHFESRQFMDEEDGQVEDLDGLLTQRFGDLLSFFRKHEPSIGEWLAFAPDDVLQELIRKIASATMDHVSEMIGEWEIQDDYWYDHLRKEGYVYPEGHEEEGQIDWDKVADADISYTDWNYEAADFINQIQNAVDLTPQEVREMSRDVDYDYVSDPEDISKLDSLLAFNVSLSGKRNGDGGVSDWMQEHIYVRKTKEGQWDVKLFYRYKDGTTKEYEIH